MFIILKLLQLIMLKKFLFLLMSLAICLPLCAQVSFVSVTNEDAHSKKEDFWHTFEYYIIPSQGKVSKCQATRIAKNWFATAAHCVKTACQNGCTLRMDLLEQAVSVFVDAKHTPKKPAVFIHPSYNPSVPVAYDFALLKMDVGYLPAKYYLRPQGKVTQNTEVTRRYFEEFLKRNPVARREFDQALRPHLPPILVFSGLTRRIDRTLSVISIFDGKRNLLQNPYPTEYVKELGFAYTKNFGVRKGMSGSGVMTNTGELAGIISATLGIGPEGKPGKEYFMFAVFNPDLMEFMEETMGSDYYKLERKDAYPNYVSISRTDHSEVISIMKNYRQRTQKESLPKNNSHQ